MRDAVNWILSLVPRMRGFDVHIIQFLLSIGKSRMLVIQRHGSRRRCSLIKAKCPYVGCTRFTLIACAVQDNTFFYRCILAHQSQWQDSRPV